MLKYQNQACGQFLVRMQTFQSGTFPMLVMLVFCEVKVIFSKHASTFPVPTQDPNVSHTFVYASCSPETNTVSQHFMLFCKTSHSVDNIWELASGFNGRDSSQAE